MELFRLKTDNAVHHCHLDGNFVYPFRIRMEDILAQNDEIRQFAGLQGSLLSFFKGEIGAALCIEGDSLINAKVFLRVPALWWKTFCRFPCDSTADTP